MHPIHQLKKPPMKFNSVFHSCYFKLCWITLRMNQCVPNTAVGGVSGCIMSITKKATSSYSSDPIKKKVLIRGIAKGIDY